MELSDLLIQTLQIMIMFSMRKKCCLIFSPQSKREGHRMDQAGCHNWEQLLKLGLWDRAWGAGFSLVLGDDKEKILLEFPYI